MIMTDDYYCFSYDSMSQLCNRYNKAIDSILQLVSTFLFEFISQRMSAKEMNISLFNFVVDLEAYLN